jgi:hypothetical protein
MMFNLEVETLDGEIRVGFELPNGVIIEAYGDSVADALHNLADTYSDSWLEDE